mmetsp:Transcript_31738/g.66505  ORF Transcript_31738/g.66505 Transcript_31738/m.66505 type:complete len:298 (+) Transcript_31738:130-1023(+)
MPLSEEDVKRLPPMVPCSEVAETRRLEELKAFRRYLVDTGAVKALVKLYQHTAKHEMRMDNPTVTKDFLAAYAGENPGTAEAERLEEENAVLRARNTELSLKADQLAFELQRQTRLIMSRALWGALLAPEFWEVAGPGEQPQEGQLTLEQCFRRLCGNKVDKKSKQVLVDLMRPPSFTAEAASVAVPMEAFCEWLAVEAPEAVQAWCADVLLSRLESVSLPEEPPFERAIVLAIQKLNSYPKNLDDVQSLVRMDKGLQAFLEAIVDRFAGAGAIEEEEVKEAEEEAIAGAEGGGGGA